MSVEAKHHSWLVTKCPRNNEGNNIPFVVKIRSDFRDRKIRIKQISATLYSDHCRRFRGCPEDCVMRKLAGASIEEIRNSFDRK